MPFLLSHDQDLLRNSLPITAIAICSRGDLIAAGHEDTKVLDFPATLPIEFFPVLFDSLTFNIVPFFQVSQGPAFPVSVWSNTAGQRKLLYQLDGLLSAPSSLKFSPDGKLLVGTGALDSYIVWDLESADVLIASKTDKPVSTG